MPIYEYRCEDCKHEFETLVMKHNEIVTCPTCSSDQLQKLLSAHSVGRGSPDTPCGNAPCSPVPMCAGGGCGS
ncbi:MAG: zinc ribbon domain-containing protein [Mariprofundaceae bacterium]